jgi:hypothetical protein
MKKHLLNIGLTLIIIIGLISCQEPGPTELLPDENTIDDDLQIELLSPSPDEFVYANGYDSTGITQPTPTRASIITVNDIKNTTGSTTLESAFYGAVFFDKQSPIKNNAGKTIGYKTRYIGRTFFNGDTARVLPYILRYKEQGQIKDTLAGLLHLLRINSRRGRHPNNDFIKFRLNPIIGQSIQFNILTPPEVTGNVRISGTPGASDFGLDLTWNKANTPIEIILGGQLKNRDEAFPLYRLRTKDDGHLRIPGSLLRKIPFDHFKQLVITFIRRFNTNITGNSLNDNFVSANNIHNIRLPVP